MAAILLAAVGTWVIIQYVSNADERALQGQEVVDVLVVDEPIPAGTPVLEAAAFMSSSQVPLDVRVPNALENLDPVRGLVTAVDLLPGEQVVAERFVEEAELVQDFREIELPPGLLELTVTVSAERSVGGSLVPGDLVAVLSSFEPFTLDAVEPEDEEDLNSFLNNDGEATTLTLRTPNSTGISVHKALVTRVQQNRVTQEDGALAGGSQSLPTSDLLVSLAVAPGDAEQIVFTAEFGAIWLARESDSAVEEDPVLVITRANVYR
ncbi:MAG: hypothetical protein HKN91_04410 [Acidimicrobiia bacterium]|nr:hypothetical protein [Acidimicrobiia bacterium]